MILVIEEKARATREALGDALLELGETNSKVVALDADLAKSTYTIKFAQKFPERFVECGIQEQNMMGVAAGLARAGKICFTGSFAIFACGRAFEMVRNIIGYCRLNVKICPTHAGLSVGEDGSSHQTYEDIALMRTIPGMKVIVPADYNEAKSAILKSAEIDGPVFIRLGRPAVPLIFSSGHQFELGKYPTLRCGKDVSIFACGLMVSASLEAAEKLAGEGIEAEVINASTIKPLDEETILESVQKTGKVVTAEEHSVIGGLGSAISEFLGEKLSFKLRKVGIKDSFGQSGSVNDLLKAYGLTADDIYRAALSLLE